jgi:hypothetical protein
MYKLFDFFSSFAELFGNHGDSENPKFGDLTEDSRGSHRIFLFSKLVRACVPVCAVCVAKPSVHCGW